MITEANNAHRKHADLKRPAYGDFGRNELAILGAPCGVIQEYTKIWASLLGNKKISYVDAEHGVDEVDQIYFEMTYTDKISYQQLNFRSQPNNFKTRALFNDADLILINGNHLYGKKQIVIIHPQRSLEHKLDKLTDVALILLAEGQDVPRYLRSAIANINAVPVLSLDDEKGIAGFLSGFIEAAVPHIKGLVLAGGKSTRMHTNKGSIAYHGKSQRAHLFGLLEGLCTEVFVSGKAEDDYPVIEDTFTGLGPFGGILSAMQRRPDVTWLTIACDLPYLTENTLTYLIAHRNPSKIATAFLDSDGKFPEPLITIWEPRAYPVMLQFLSQGYSCPRKVLINSDIELLDAPDVSEFRNVNLPHERDEALRFFGAK